MHTSTSCLVQSQQIEKLRRTRILNLEVQNKALMLKNLRKFFNRLDISLG
jgi:hypothetical protein